MFDEWFEYYSFQEYITTSIKSERTFWLDASSKKIRNFFISFEPVKYLAHICKSKEKKSHAFLKFFARITKSYQRTTTTLEAWTLEYMPHKINILVNICRN